MLNMNENSHYLFDVQFKGSVECILFHCIFYLWLLVVLSMMRRHKMKITPPRPLNPLEYMMLLHSPGYSGAISLLG
ncbi:hypothetical protein BDP27DRAFT_672400 [Rhodocollybia butyracea]|uniref:Uncharacterized protein n=1 Tax=Rhodocollybia butyracea TaxID=206335 RepID=A0A9P5PTI1_9AGAR|nr:hypothetical protein BDP27DRAFT_672400 [Rhodocollybia butyracea]